MKLNTYEQINEQIHSLHVNFFLKHVDIQTHLETVDDRKLETQPIGGCFAGLCPIDGGEIFIYGICVPQRRRTVQCQPMNPIGSQNLCNIEAEREFFSSSNFSAKRELRNKNWQFGTRFMA